MSLLAVSLLAVAVAAEPVTLHVPAQGFSPSVQISGPDGPLRVSASTREHQLGARTLTTIALRFEATPSGWEAAKDGRWAVGPEIPPGVFIARSWTGELWKCLPIDEGAELVEREIWSDADRLFGGLAVERPLAQARSDGEDAWVVTGTLDGFLHPSVDTWSIQIALPGGPVQVVRLELDRAANLNAAEAQLLSTYQELGPALLMARSDADGVTVLRVGNHDVCGETTLLTVPFGSSDLQTLAWPTPNDRLATANGWVFVEQVPADRPGPIPRPSIASADPSSMVFVGDTYERALTGVRSSPGRAVATFVIGDFAGCMGAGCGDPTNLRQAIAIWEDGKMTLHIEPMPEQER